MNGLQIPRVIRVLGQEFMVRVVSRDEAISRDATHSTIGQTNLNLQTITIRGPEDLSPHQAADTLLHEVLHCVVYLFNLNPYINEDADEDFVHAMAPALLHTLRENPALVEALMSDLSQVRAGEAHAHGAD